MVTLLLVFPLNSIIVKIKRFDHSVCESEPQLWDFCNWLHFKEKSVQALNYYPQIRLLVIFIIENSAGKKKMRSKRCARCVIILNLTCGKREWNFCFGKAQNTIQQTFNKPENDVRVRVRAWVELRLRLISFFKVFLRVSRCP